MAGHSTPVLLAPTNKSSRYALGLFFILLQCIVWIAAAVLTQRLYDDDLAPPFLLTYVGMSLLAFLLPIQLFQEHLQRNNNTETEFDEIRNVASVDTLDVQLATAKHCTDYADLASASTHQLSNDHRKAWTHRRHFTAALLLAPAMFGADYAFNSALISTSVASATVLVSTQSMFVFLLAVILKLEPFSFLKLAGVLAVIIGTALTTADDMDDSHGHAVGGDLCAVLAALLYAGYTVQVRLFCPENEDLYSMPLLLGYIGLICAIIMAPVGFYLVSKVPWSPILAGLILIKGLMDFAITDYCLFRAIILTNTTVATVGLGLTIPMAFAADRLMEKGGTVTTLGVVGAVAVAVGFLVVNLVPDKTHEETDPILVKFERTSSDSGIAPQKDGILV